MDTHADYLQTLDFLYSQLPMFSRLGKSAIKPDLTNTLKLCDYLGNPEEKFSSIHIAGTNGKGSTSHMLAAVLQDAGYKVGLYTSPHLVDFRERIRINGEPVSKEWVVEFVRQHKPTIQLIEPSFFEMTVVMAFAAFAMQEVDYAIIETGLGGRLDSTNVITPLLSIITNISYDHKDLLGDTLQQIAHEKAGIIKPQIPVVIGEQHAETENVFFEHSVHKKSNIYYADALWDLVRIHQDERYQHLKAIHKATREMYDLKTDLLGHYQLSNIKTTLAAIQVLNATQTMALSLPDALKALAKVKRTTGLRGRWERVQEHPLIIADVAHNEAGMQEVIQQWRLVNATEKHIVTGFVKDKDVDGVLSALPKDAHYYFCQADVPRALPAGELQEMAARKGLQGEVYNSVAEAVQAARHDMQAGDALLITGSFFIVGEALEYMDVNNGRLFPTSLEEHH